MAADGSLRFADHLQEIVSRFDRQYRHSFVNSAAERHTGLKREAFLGKTNRELGMPAELLSQWEATLAAVFSSSQANEIQFSFPGPLGMRHFTSIVCPEIGVDGAVVSVVSIARDITELVDIRSQLLTQRQIQQTLEGKYEAELARLLHSSVGKPLQSTAHPALSPFAHLHNADLEGHFKAIVDSSDDAIISKTLDGLVRSWNRGAQAIFGYTEEEMIGRPLLLLFPPDRQLEEQFIVEKLIEGESVYHFETVRIHKNGSRVDVSVTISPIRDSDGKIIGASKVARDISPIKLQQRRMLQVLDATSDGLWEWDLKTGDVYRSAKCYELIGSPQTDGSSTFNFFKDSIHGDDLSSALQSIEAHRAGLAPLIDFEFRAVHKTGSDDRWLRAKGRIVEWDTDKTPVRILGTLSDISKQKKSEWGLVERERQLLRVLEGSDQAYWDWNMQTNVLQVSPRWETMLGYAPGESKVSMESWAEYVHADDLALVQKALRAHLRGEAPDYRVEVRCKAKSGGWRWILIRGRIIERTADGKPKIMSGTRTDVTDRKLQELVLSEASLVFVNAYEGILVTDAAKTIAKVNPAFTRITGYSAEEAIGQTPKLLASDRHDVTFYEEMWATVAREGLWSGEIWNKRKNGEVYAEHLSISVVKDSHGIVQNYIGVFSDITQLKSHEAELDRAANYDALTGVPNRRLLLDRLDQTILRCNRSGKSLAVCYLDLDGFKVINDTHGHATGDQVLIGVAKKLKEVMRHEDTVARIGGDEFVLLFSDMESTHECSQILDRVLDVVSSPTVVDSMVFSVSTSIGVSLYPEDNVDADALLRHADQAMYLAKDAGKNRFHLFDPSSDRRAHDHRRLLVRMRSALENQEFQLYYQPKVSLLSGELIGVEALIRWMHPEKGLLPPSEFLSHIHGSDLEQPVGEWVIRTALQQAQAWNRSGKFIAISVNISAAHLMRPNFRTYLESCLRAFPAVEPRQLELEILETAAIDDMDLAIEILKCCRDLGVTLALDDFGTGYSSLTYLRRLPVDTLKIDQSFVRDMLADAEDMEIVEAVIRMANAFRLTVIAEGVETMAHGAALLKLGCTLAQGYGIARPMSSVQVLGWEETWQKQQSWKSLTTS